MQQNKFFIILEALLGGCVIQFGKKYLFLHKKKVYETFYSKIRKKQVTRTSEISLQSFFNQYSKIDNTSLKRIYGDIKLYNLAKKLNASKSSTL